MKKSGSKGKNGGAPAVDRERRILGILLLSLGLLVAIGLVQLPVPADAL